jgi:uncharacterized protein YegJ (DUF2314 family)
MRSPAHHHALWLVVLCAVAHACVVPDRDAAALAMEDSVIVSPDGDTVRFVAADDWEFNRARQDAQCTIPAFRHRFQHPPAGQSDLMLKAAFETSPGMREHMWTAVLELPTDSTFRVRIENDPSDSTRFHYGDTVVVRLNDITDWYAVERDTLVAGFTIRLHRTRLNADQRRRADSSRPYVITDERVDLQRLWPGCR